ncbi:hypothetical protein GCM10025787_51780 [Saccharopolyspora rosea]
MRAGRNCTPLRCLVRRVWPGANPMRRPTDWFEPVALLIIVLVGVVTVVFAVGTAQSELRDRMGQVQVEQSTRHQVQASVVAQVSGEGTATRSVAVRWGQPPDEHFAVVDVPSRTPPNGTVPVWLDQRGRLVAPPMTPGEATQAAGIAGAGVLVGSAVGTLLLFALARWVVVRRRLAAWAAEWEEVGPQWRNHAP